MSHGRSNQCPGALTLKHLTWYCTWSWKDRSVHANSSRVDSLTWRGSTTMLTKPPLASFTYSWTDVGTGTGAWSCNAWSGNEQSGVGVQKQHAAARYCLCMWHILHNVYIESGLHEVQTCLQQSVLTQAVKAWLKSCSTCQKVSMSITSPAVKLQCGASPLAPNLRDSANPCSIMLYNAILL